MKLSKLLSGVIFISASAFAQQKEEVLLNVGGKDITKSEFETIYHKNNNKTAGDRKSIEEYLELFINFKLKVREAEAQGLDTTTAFKNELEGYRRQLAQPYLVDNEVNDKLLKEAYERMKTDVRASHILIKCDQNALPKDTLAAYNKTIATRDRILKGEAFDKVAMEVSEDPSAKENAGDLGFFTVLQMVYPFESAAFSMKVGDVSMPVRTRFGYHILKTTDRRDAQGQIQVAHIMVKSPKTATSEDDAKAKAKIDELYQQLKGGKDFADLAKEHSEDKGSAKKGGELPWFGTGRMVPEFEMAAFRLKNKGDYSEPVKTQYGWHIIKLIDQKPIPSYDEAKADLKARIQKDSRSQKSRESLIAKLKKEYKFKENPKAKEDIYKAVDTLLFSGRWVAGNKKLDKTMFTIADQKHSQKEFAQYIETHQSARGKAEIQPIIDQMYNSFVEEKVLAYEENNLAKKYPEYKALLQEYRDGILLFDLMDKMVWSKAVKDTSGLKDFYEKNKQKFMWGERTDAAVYTAANEAVAKQLRMMLTDKKKKYTDEEITTALNKDSQLNIKIENGKFSKGDNEFVDQATAEGLNKDIKKDGKVIIVDVKKKLPAEPKSLNEAKGLITAEYQNQLEKEWIQQLKAKYTVKVNQEVLNTVK
jgi:peptidyl-prolyl cis-trans isomerase SurA